MRQRTASAGGKQSATTRVYEFVREQITSGGFPAGELITETQVAEAVGVSRTPVREAFAVLDREGWLRVYPKRGALVVPMTHAEVGEVFEVRRIIEGWALEHLVAQPVSEPTADALRAALEANRDALQADARRFHESGRVIHQIIVESAGNSLLSDIWTELSARQLRLGSSPVERAGGGWREQAVQEHESLVNAILDGDREKALRLVHEHLVNQERAERRPIRR